MLFARAAYVLNSRRTHFCVYAETGSVGSFVRSFVRSQGLKCKPSKNTSRLRHFAIVLAATTAAGLRNINRSYAFCGHRVGGGLTTHARDVTVCVPPSSTSAIIMQSVRWWEGSVAIFACAKAI